MKCKSCKREIDSDSIFCKWCGVKQLKERGEISVPKPRKLASGSYSAQLMVNGERVTVTAPTEKEYYTQARAVKSGLVEAAKKPQILIVGDVVDKYIRTNKNVLSPSTLRGYQKYRDNRFQAIMAKDAEKVDWQKAVNDELEDVQPKTVLNAYHLITASFNAAGHPLPKINLPKVPKSQRPWLDFTQIRVFTDAIQGKDCELGALLALHSLRRSELYALTSDKIDTAKGIITVRGAAVLDADGKRIDKDTNKNEQSARTIPILIPRLEELLANANGPLLTTHINTLYWQINSVCDAAGLPKVGVHGLRHSFASLAYHLKWSEEHTRQVGGWKDGKIVHDIYTHLALQDQNDDVQSMRQFFSAP